MTADVTTPRINVLDPEFYVDPVGRVPVAARGSAGVLGPGAEALGDLALRRHHRDRGRRRALLVVRRVASAPRPARGPVDHQHGRPRAPAATEPRRPPVHTRSGPQPRGARARHRPRDHRRRRTARRVRSDRGHRLAPARDHDRRPARLPARALGAGAALVGADHAARRPDLARRPAARVAPRARAGDPGVLRDDDPDRQGTAGRSP